MTDFARSEVLDLSRKQVELEARLKILLLPKDPLDDRNIMLEVGAGSVFSNVFTAYSHPESLLQTRVPDVGKSWDWRR